MAIQSSYLKNITLEIKSYINKLIFPLDLAKIQSEKCLLDVLSIVEEKFNDLTPAAYNKTVYPKKFMFSNEFINRSKDDLKV